MREEFEEWAQNESVYGQGFSLTQSHNNMDYLNSRSQSGWKAWQAATALQDARVRELEEALKGLLAVISETRGLPAHNAVQSALNALSATARES